MFDSPIKVDDYILHYPSIMADSDVDRVIDGLFIPLMSSSEIDEATLISFHELCETLILEQYMKTEMVDVPWADMKQLYHVEIGSMEWKRNEQILHNHSESSQYLVSAAMILDDGPFTIRFGSSDKTKDVLKGDIFIFPANYCFRFTLEIINDLTCRVCIGSLATLDQPEAALA